MDPRTDPDQRPIPGEVVQAKPGALRWGTVFVIVTECKDWGVKGYFLTHGDVDDGPEAVRAYVRVPHGDYVRIGIAQWWSL